MQSIPANPDMLKAKRGTRSPRRLRDNLTIVLFLLGWRLPGAVALALTVFIVSFFRDPERAAPAGPGLDWCAAPRQ